MNINVKKAVLGQLLWMVVMTIPMLILKFAVPLPNLAWKWVLWPFWVGPSLALLFIAVVLAWFAFQVARGKVTLKEEDK